MTISEMHVWFRQYAQQMGMQNVRAILPEQIDNLINTAIKDIVDEVINKNVGTTNDKVITDNSKLANINALRTLYRVKTLFCTDDVLVINYKNNPYTFYSELIEDEALYFVDFSIRYTEPLPDPDNYEIKAPTDLQDPYVSSYKANKNYFYELQEHIYSGHEDNPFKDTDNHPLELYKDAKTAMDSLRKFIEHQLRGMKTTKWFPIRIIDDSYLADVLNDWVLAPRMRSPVMVIYSTEHNTVYKERIIGKTTFDVYLGENDSEGFSNILSKKYIAEIRCSYIKKPKEVHYLSDVGGDNVDSDLPEQLQIPMLKHAVDLYRISIQGSLYANQENAKQNQQEIARNNARPDNEGYQS